MPIGDQVGRQDDDVIRRLAKLEAQYNQIIGLAGSAKAIAAAVQTGLGALASSGTTWAGPVSSPSTVAAAGAITAGGNATVGGIIRNVSAYSNPITSSYRAVWVTSVDGQFGFNLSSREFKQDIETLVLDPAIVLKLRAVTYRYIAAVEAEGDAAETQVGLIAEEVHDLGLEWLVEYDNGKPCGIKFHLVAFALLVVAQDHEARLAALEKA